MNERIRELAEQARYYIDPDFDIEFEVFAKLIVSECIDVLNPEGDLTSMREEFGRRLAMNMIKEHFGVKE